MRRVGTAGEDHAGNAWIRGQYAAHGRAVTRQQLHHITGHARFVQQLDDTVGNDRGLLGGFCQHRVACNGGGNDLTAEDGYREVPRANGGKNTFTTHHQAVGFTGRARQFDGFAKRLFSAHGVVTAEINRFFDFIDAVSEQLAAFTGAECHQLRHVLFHQVAQPTHNRCALGYGSRVPAREGFPGSVEGFRCLLFAGPLHAADGLAAVERRSDAMGIGAIVGHIKR